MVKGFLSYGQTNKQRLLLYIDTQHVDSLRLVPTLIFQNCHHQVFILEDLPIILILEGSGEHVIHLLDQQLARSEGEGGGVTMHFY